MAPTGVKAHGEEICLRPPLVKVRQRSEGVDEVSVCGPLTSAALTALPSSRATRIDPQPFRLFLCRRLHLPPLSPSHRTCRCGRLLNQLGHHRAACPEAGVLGRRGLSLECAASCPGLQGGRRSRVDQRVRARHGLGGLHNASRQPQAGSGGGRVWAGSSTRQRHSDFVTFATGRDTPDPGQPISTSRRAGSCSTKEGRCLL